MGFLAEYDALSQQGLPAAQVVAAQFGLFQKWLFQNPAELFAELREHRPIFVMSPPAPVVVSRFRDVLEVADLDGIYGVAPYARTNGIVMDGANFLLGMEATAQYESERAALKLAARRTDLDAIRTFVAGAAKCLTDAAAATGRLELPDGFARMVPVQLAGHYFGAPGPDPQTMMRWTRTIFTELFLNLNNQPDVAAAGAQAGREFGEYLDHLVAEVHARGDEEGVADRVLDRLVAMQRVPGAGLSDRRIRDNLTGLLVGMTDNTAIGVCAAMDVLFNFPEQLAAAVAAARAADPEQLLPFVLEALRFHSPAPILVRLSNQEHVLARGTPRETTVPAGRLVFAANGSAMMDETELEAPQEFRTGRPTYQYLHFGWGQHRCFGQYISQVQIVEIVRSLLVLNGIRRAAGPEGSLVYEGIFPARFSVEFEPSKG
jgi:cytochrome P450